MGENKIKFWMHPQKGEEGEYQWNGGDRGFQMKWGSANSLKSFGRIGNFGGWVSQSAKVRRESGLYVCMYLPPQT